MHKVLILGGDSDHNLGDAAILAGLCETLTTARRSNLEITVTSARRGLTPPAGVQRVLRRGCSGAAALIRAAHESDLVIVGGGGLLQDDDSRIKVPYWACRLAALGMVTPRLVGHSLGVGPLLHAESRRFAGIAVGSLQSVSVRDSFAHRWLSPCTGRPVDIVPDPAFLLTPAPTASALDYLKSLGVAGNRPIIGIALRRWFHRLGGVLPHRVRVRAGLDRGRGDGRLQMAHLIGTIASVVGPLLRRLDATLLLMPTYNVGHEDDAAACRELATRLGDAKVRLARIGDPRLYKAVAGQLRLMIASRMHPLILSASMGVPVVGLAYNGKFEGLFELLGLPQRVIWLDQLSDLAGANRLEQQVADALSKDDDLQHRCARLAAVAREKTQALLQLPADPVARAA